MAANTSFASTISRGVARSSAPRRMEGVAMEFGHDGRTFGEIGQF